MSKQASHAPAAVRSLVLDRRRFLGGLGGAAAAALVPVPSDVRAALGSSGAGDEKLTDWTIDDMWGVYTRYAEPVDFGRAHVGEQVPAPAPIDAVFGV